MAEEQKDMSYQPKTKTKRRREVSSSLSPRLSPSFVQTHRAQVIPSLPAVLALVAVHSGLDSDVVSDFKISLVGSRESRDLSSRFVSENERSLENERSVSTVDVVVHWRAKASG